MYASAEIGFGEMRSGLLEVKALGSRTHLFPLFNP
jgi:hypothetical protein